MQVHKKKLLVSCSEHETTIFFLSDVLHETCDFHVLGPLHMSSVDQAGSVTGMNFALSSYVKFQPGFRGEKRTKILGTSSGVKFGKQSKHSETQKF